MPRSRSKEDTSQIGRIVEDLSRPLQEAADALASLAASWQAWVELERQRFAKENPHIEVGPVTVGRAKYDRPEDKPEEQGAVFPEEKYIGPREARILARQKRQARRSS